VAIIFKRPLLYDKYFNVFISASELLQSVYYPNSDIENTFIVQPLDTSSKSKKCHITNRVGILYLHSTHQWFAL